MRGLARSVEISAVGVIPFGDMFYLEFRWFAAEGMLATTGSARERPAEKKGKRFVA
jgi:hypothetical protein